MQLVAHESTTGETGSPVTAQLVVDGEHRTVTGEGNGPIAAFVAGLQADLGVEIDVVDYSEHAVGAGTDAVAVAYVETQRPDGAVRWGGPPREHHHGLPAGGDLGGQPPAGGPSRRRASRTVARAPLNERFSRLGM